MKALAKRVLKRLKCLTVGHADDFLVLAKPFCLRCFTFTQGRPSTSPLTSAHLAYLREHGWTDDDIRGRFPALRKFFSPC